MTEYSHKLVLEIGLDLTNYLSPQNISGVKAYLGVNNDSDVVQSIGEDQYKRIESLLIANGFNVIGAVMNKIQDKRETTESNSIDVREEADVESQKSVSESENIDNSGVVTEEEKEVLNVIKKAKEKIGNGVITKVAIDNSYEGKINSVEMLKQVSGIFADAEIDFKDTDSQMYVEYMDAVGKVKNITFN